MNINLIAHEIPTGSLLSRLDIFTIALKADPSFRETLLRNLLEKLMKPGMLSRIGRNCYIKEKSSDKPIYENDYSETAQELLAIMKKRFPLLSYRVWELSWLNEFLNHLIARNLICLDVEKDGCEYVFESLKAEYNGKLLLAPNADQLHRYAEHDTIIINRLVTEAPFIKENSPEVPLEKIIVDLLANKAVRSTIHAGEIPNIIVDMVEKYTVDRTKLLRYASRRSKKDELSIILESVKW